MTKLLRFTGPLLLVVAMITVLYHAAPFVAPREQPRAWRAIFQSGEGTQRTIDFKAQSIRLFSGGVDVCVEFITDGRTEGAVCGLVAVGRPE